MLELKCLQSVSERDIDMLIVEELESCTQFREWMASRVYEMATYKDHIGAWHSVSDPLLGESDIVYLFSNESDGRSAILIENKIDASPQPDQGRRYQERGKLGLDNGLWDEFRTCLIAPRKYLDSSKHSEEYDLEITYEELMAFFLSRRSLDGRFSHKALVIKEGIDQNRRGYQPKIDLGLTRFVGSYAEFAISNYPDCGIERSKPRAPQNTWINFRPATFPKDVQITHQTTAGFVKLFFAGAASNFDALSSLYSPYVPDGGQVVLASKSVAIAIPVPKIDDPSNRLFSEYEHHVATALERVAQLVSMVEKVRLITAESSKVP